MILVTGTTVPCISLYILVTMLYTLAHNSYQVNMKHVAPKE